MRNLLYSQETHNFDVRDCETMKISNDVNCLKEKIIYAKIRFVRLFVCLQIFARNDIH